MKLRAFFAGTLIAAAIMPTQARADERERPWVGQRQQEGLRRVPEPPLRWQEEREDARGRGSRLTVEERQQLRQDIRRHGRDLYRERPRHFRD